MPRTLVFLLLFLAPLLLGPKYYLSGVPKSVNVGDSFVVFVMLDLEELPRSIGQSVSIQYDTKRLLPIAWEEHGAPPYQFKRSTGIGNNSELEGVIGECEAVSLYGFVYTQAPFVVCQIEFEALAPGKARLAPYFDKKDGLLGETWPLVEGVELRGSSTQVKR